MIGLNGIKNKHVYKQKFRKFITDCACTYIDMEIEIKLVSNNSEIHSEILKVCNSKCYPLGIRNRKAIISPLETDNLIGFNDHI